MERGNEIGSCDHPGPIVKEEEFMKGDMEWRDIGSGVVARTFPKMDKLVVTTRGGPPVADIHRRVVRSLSTGNVIDDCVVGDTPDTVLNRRLRFPDDVRIELTMKGALKMFERQGTDIAEIFSQPRITQEAAVRDYDGIRLIPGWSLDLTREDPKTGRPWDLSSHAVRQRVRKMVKETKPFMVIGSPPCTMFSTMQNMNKGKIGKERFDKMLEDAKEHIRFCVEVYRIQMKEGRFSCTSTRTSQRRGKCRKS